MYLGSKAYMDRLAYLAAMAIRHSAGMRAIAKALDQKDKQ